jgi:hypothetical protein
MLPDTKTELCADVSKAATIVAANFPVVFCVGSHAHTTFETCIFSSLCQNPAVGLVTGFGKLWSR